MTREKLIAFAAVALVAGVLIGTKVYLVGLGTDTWPGQTTEKWVGNVPQPKRQPGGSS